MLGIMELKEKGFTSSLSQCSYVVVQPVNERFDSLQLEVRPEKELCEQWRVSHTNCAPAANSVCLVVCCLILLLCHTEKCLPYCTSENRSPSLTATK